jgi:hypothetical protein
MCYVLWLWCQCPSRCAKLRTLSFLIKSIMLCNIFGLIKSELVGFFSIYKNLIVESKKLLPMKKSFYKFFFFFSRVGCFLRIWNPCTMLQLTTFNFMYQHMLMLAICRLMALSGYHSCAGLTPIRSWLLL